MTIAVSFNQANMNMNMNMNMDMTEKMDGKVEIAMGPEEPKDVAKPEEEEPKAPYYYYRDHSYLPDPDPTKPVTIPGRIPTFPAKLFAILSRSDLADIISWMPHGRSWKVHKPREFEVKVIPSYFDHAKFSSFIRQANGWGFKRVCTKGVDRNSHYHELFLRGMPHLIKFMKRPVSGSKVHQSQPLHAKGKNCDPDFYRISQDHPLPELCPKMLHPLDESSFLNPCHNNRVLSSAGVNAGRSSTSFQAMPRNTITGSAQQGAEASMTQLQAFFAQSDETNNSQSSTASNSQAFLLPRVPEQPQTVTSQAQSSCPMRQQERDLDPLTILLNDVYDENPTIEDPIIQSLVSIPTVPPPSSLNLEHKFYNAPSTPPMAPKPVLSQQTMFHAPSAPIQVVSPLPEEKQVIQLPEPVPFRDDECQSDRDHDLMFEDPFAGGFMAHDFW